MEERKQWEDETTASHKLFVEVDKLKRNLDKMSDTDKEKYKKALTNQRLKIKVLFKEAFFEFFCACCQFCRPDCADEAHEKIVDLLKGVDWRSLAYYNPDATKLLSSLEEVCDTYYSFKCKKELEAYAKSGYTPEFVKIF